MRVFGRTLGEYVRFEAGLLILIAVVGVLRFALYQAGIHPSAAPNASPAATPEKVVSIARWFSMSAVLVVGALYLGVATHRRGFGGYKHLFLLNLLPGIVAHWTSAAGVLIAIVFQTDTIYTLPQFSGGEPAGRTFQHALVHAAVAPFLTALAGTVLSSLVMLATRRRPKKTAAPQMPEPPAPPVEEPPAPPSEPAATVE
jgi:hypothetical protein